MTSPPEITDQMVEDRAKAMYNEGAFHGHNRWLYVHDPEGKAKYRAMARAELEKELAAR